MARQTTRTARGLRAGAQRGERPDWGESPWRIEVEIPPVPPPAQCDVAVIGAGFTGLSAAYHLARRGCRVAVLEAARVGDGASGRTGGLTLEGTATGPRPGVEGCLDELARLTAEAEIACDLEGGGCWELEHGPERPQNGMCWRDGGAFLGTARRVAGGVVDPGKLVTGLARAALRAGATIHEHAPVRGIEAGDRVCLQVGDTTLRADHAVVALNGYTAELLSLPGELRAPLTLALCTEAVGEATLQTIGLADRVPFYTADMPYLWGRTVGGSRLIFGAGLVFPADGIVRHVDINAPECAAAFARLEARVCALHPSLADVAITHRWGGPIAFRSAMVPMIGPAPGMPRVIVTGAYAGHGVALGVCVGRLVADAIAHGTSLPSWAAI